MNFREYLVEAAKEVDVLTSGSGTISSMKLVKGTLGRKLKPVTNFKSPRKALKGKEFYEGKIDGNTKMILTDKALKSEGIYVIFFEGKDDSAQIKELETDGSATVINTDTSIETANRWLKQNNVNESKEDMYYKEIARLSGTRASAVKVFIEDNELSAYDLMQAIGQKKTSGQDVMASIAGKAGNKIQTALIKQFKA